MSVHVLCVDLQHEFASPGGALFRPRPCVPFLTDVLLPAARDRAWPIHEIRADYRDPAKAPAEWGCAPGSWDGDSLIPPGLLATRPWFKATPSPSWTRDGAGDPDAAPGPARPDPDAFTAWLGGAVGPPQPDATVVVVGLMLEICVLSTVQELFCRGYRPHVLLDGVDTFAGTREQKQQLAGALFPFWAAPLTWEELQSIR